MHVEEQMNEHFLESEFYFQIRTFIKAVPGCIYYKSKSGYYLACSDYLVYESGFDSSHDIIGKTDYDLFTREHADIIRDNDLQVLKTGEVITAEEVIILPNGIRKVYEVVKAAFRNEQGDIIGIIGNSIDITDRTETEKKLKKAKKEAELANRIKTEFISKVEHDLRVPVEKIVSYASKREELERNEEQKERWQVMAQSSEEVMKILNSLLEFARSESEIPVVFEESLNIREIVSNVIEMELPASKEKKLTLKYRVAKDIPEYIQGDVYRITHILTNLVNHSVQSTPSGFIRISVEKGKKPNFMVNPYQFMLKVIIEDSGNGLPQEAIQKIFEKFYHAESSIWDQYTDSGLRLYLTKRMLSEIGGQIDVCSELNRGTRFTCCIPCKVSFFKGKQKPLLASKRNSSCEEGKEKIKIELKEKGKIKKSRSIKKQSDTREEEAIGKGSRVLLVEDDLIAGRVGVHCLSNKFGCIVDHAETGASAIKYAQEERYDLILLDLGLPDTTGIEVAKQVRSHSKNKGTPIVTLTAHSREMSEKETQEWMNDFLSKPISPEKIETILKRWVTSSSPSRKQESKKAVGNEKVEPEQKESIIDIKQGMQALGTGEEFVLEVLAILYDQSPHVLNELKKAFQKKEWKKMSEVVHKLRGGSSACGTPRLHHAAELLDEALFHGKTKVTTLYNDLLKEIQIFQKEYKKKWR